MATKKRATKARASKAAKSPAATKKARASKAAKSPAATTKRSASIRLATKTATADPPATPPVYTPVTTTKGNIGGTVFYDINANRRHDAGEPAIGGVGVTLFKLPDADKPFFQAGLTNPSLSGGTGSYQFADLPDGDYLVEFPANASFTQVGVGTPINLLASDSRGMQVGVRIATAVEGLASQIVNFGYKLDTACIFGSVAVEPTTPRCAGPAPATTPQNVPVTLLKDGVVAGQTLTDQNGYYEFQGLDCGNYSLVFPLQFQGQDLTQATDSVDVGFVGPGMHVGPRNVTYGGALGTVRGKVILESGIGIKGVPLILDDVGKALAPRRTAATDDFGIFEFPDVPSGDYELSAPPSLSSGIGSPLPNVTGGTQHVNVSGDVLVADITYRSGVLIDSFGTQFKQLGDAATTIASIIPTATQSAPASPALTPGAVGGLAYDQIIDLSLAKVLGARPNGDPQRLQNLLTSSFEKKQQNGTSYYVWRSRGATPLDPSTGGQLAGAQATLYGQAQDIQSAADRLLDAVFPILLDPDDGEINAVKEDIHATFADVTAEFGRTGGALLDRIDSLLPTIKTNLDELETKLGLAPGTPQSAKRVLDIAEEEQDRQNFDLLKGYITQLTGAVTQYRSQVNSFKGTLLTRLLWTVEAIPDTVRQIYSAMDDVGFGPADRRVTPISGSSAIATTIEQLLLWIETAATSDWPRRLVGGGARPNELLAIKVEAGRQKSALDTLISGIGTIIPIGAGRIQPLLEELTRELNQVATNPI